MLRTVGVEVGVIVGVLVVVGVRMGMLMGVGNAVMGTSTSWMPLMAGSWYVTLRKQPDFRQQLHLSMYLRQVLPSDFR